MSSKAGVMAGPHYAHLPGVLGAFWAQFSPSINACLCLEAGGLRWDGQVGGSALRKRWQSHPSQHGRGHAQRRRVGSSHLLLGFRMSRSL